MQYYEVFEQCGKRNVTVKLLNIAALSLTCAGDPNPSNSFFAKTSLGSHNGLAMRSSDAHELLLIVFAHHEENDLKLYSFTADSINIKA